MTFSVIEGDLFAGNYDAIGHGVNVYGVMGAGIALQFREKYPFMYGQYRQMCLREELEPGDVYPYLANDGKFIYNLASQSMPGPHARLEWVFKSVQTMFTHASFASVKTIGLPAIGCGIGGLDLEDVTITLEHLAEEYPKIDLTLVLYKP